MLHPKHTMYLFKASCLSLRCVCHSGKTPWHSRMHPTASALCIYSTSRAIVPFASTVGYLLDVRLKPGDESFAHVHDQAILLTYISLAGGPQNGRVEVNIDYASDPLTHKVSNDGPGCFTSWPLSTTAPGN